MAKVRPDVKERLVADGRWPDFTRYRTELIAGGVKPGEAIDMAIAKICPEFAESRVSKRRGRKPKAVSKEAATIAEAEAKVAEAGKRAEAIEAERKRKAESALVGKDVFAGKPKVGAAEEVLWVAKNLTVAVKPEDAPGELAWNFLMLCRESADFKVKFMLNIASDVVKRRSDEEDGDGKKWDGVKQYDLCEAMREAQP
jgi:hypothetical protein